MEEETISFKKDSDKMLYGVQGYDGEQLMAAITGYDLKVAFNMKLINSLADAESCANALADLFYRSEPHRAVNREKVGNFTT